MICRFCGQEIREGSKFCTSCGAQTQSPVSASAGKSVNVYPDNSGDQTASADIVLAKKSHKVLNIIVVVIVILVISGIIVGSFFLTGFLSKQNRIASIKDAVPTVFPNAGTWGDALDDYCDHTKWELADNEGEENDYVEFSGTIKDTSEKLYIKFLFNGQDKYNITEFKVDDVSVINDQRLEDIANDLFGNS